ncbi:uncharacterized protein METZ01_LOCUS326383, partial [marine metagenome]
CILEEHDARNRVSINSGSSFFINSSLSYQPI